MFPQLKKWYHEMLHFKSYKLLYVGKSNIGIDVVFSILATVWGGDFYVLTEKKKRLKDTIAWDGIGKLFLRVLVLSLHELDKENEKLKAKLKVKRSEATNKQLWGSD